MFYQHLHGRGYPLKEIPAAFRQICWSERTKALAIKPCREVDNEQFFVSYQGCVFSTRNAPGIQFLEKSIDSSPRSLHGRSSKEQEQRHLARQCLVCGSRSGAPWPSVEEMEVDG